MRISRLIVFIASLTATISCQSTAERQGTFNLLPLPQKFEINGASKLKYTDVANYHAGENLNLPVRGDLLKNIVKTENISAAQISCVVDNNSDLPPEGYTLDILEKRIQIEAKDEAGLLYAFMTLEQLMEDAREQDVFLPACNIVDFPALPYRAIHLDIKHHLEHTGYYYQLLDNLARYKVNGVILEFEDKIKYRRQPEVGASDALTITEWRKLSDYAKERNIEISPLIQGLGHASFVLKHDQYMGLRDDPMSDWAFNPLDPDTYQVQFDLYLDAIEATPYGRYLHVGGDEVHTTGRGSGDSALKLQLLWLGKVSKFAEEHGRIPIFWDDMPLKFANVYRPMFDKELSRAKVDSIWEVNEKSLLEFLDQFPKNCIYMRWNYQAPQTYGNIRAMEWFREHGLQVMGATAGQTRWVLMPQQESNIENIRSFAEISIKNDLNGLLLTLWDDDSPHFELYWRGITAFAEYSWAGNRRTKEEVKTVFRQREFSNTLGGEEYAFIDQLEGPVAFWKNALLVGNKRNYLIKNDDPMGTLVMDLPDREEKGAWSEKYSMRLEQAKVVLEAGDSIAYKIGQMKSAAVRNAYRLEIYEQVNELVMFSARALLALQAYDLSKTGQDEEEAIGKLKQLPEVFATTRQKFELVYGKTRKLTKPPDYILDQDHHAHLANQAISFDWQFYAEMLFLDKVEKEFKK